jgi:hypothetical protein
MSRWPVRDSETFTAELRVVVAADGVDTDAWIRARSRADDGRDPVGDQSEAAPAEAATGDTVEGGDVSRRPTRSEPADFGGGESTGVRDL